MGKYSTDSDSGDSYRKSKKKSRRRSSSESSSNSRYSSSKSIRKKCRKHKKRSGRSRSRDKDKRSRSRDRDKRSRSRDRDKRSRSRDKDKRSSRTSRKRSRSRERDGDRHSRRSRSRSYSTISRSPTRSRDRRRGRSRSSSRRRSRSKERRARDDGAELLEKLNKAAIQAMADNSKLREATLNLVNQVAERESAIMDIKSSGFAPKAFSSSASDKRPEDLTTILELPEPKPVKINLSLKDNPNSLLHPNLLLEDSDEKLNRWVRKLYLIRQRSIRGEPLMYG